MASLYKPTIVTYRLPDGSYRTPDGRRVTSTTPGAVRTVERSRKWYRRYTDGNGKTVRVPLSESKETARRMLNRIVGEAELESVGIADPLAAFRARPLLEYLEEHVSILRANGRTEKHCQKARSHVLAIFKGCEFVAIDDLDADAVTEFLADLRRGREPTPLDPSKEWYTTAEAAPLIGIAIPSLGHLATIGLLPGPAPKYLNPRRLLLHRDTVAGLIARRCRGIGVATTNRYVGAVKHFSRWLAQKINKKLKQDGYRRHRWHDPLTDLKRLNAEVDVRHQRRPLVPEDFDRFLSATRAGKLFRGLTGDDRAVIYTLAMYTGFRASELASLTPGSFDLDAEPPTVTVNADCSKHRPEDVQPLRRDVAELLRPYLAGRPRGAPVWPGRWWQDGAAIIRRDLAAAVIPYADERGEVIDFHGLRHTFISTLARAGVRLKEAQELARHSTSVLTQDYYTHIQLRDQMSALDRGEREGRCWPGPAPPRMRRHHLARAAAAPCLASPVGICRLSLALTGRIAE
jgi:integrase